MKTRSYPSISITSEREATGSRIRIADGTEPRLFAVHRSGRIRKALRNQRRSGDVLRSVLPLCEKDVTDPMGFVRVGRA